MTAAAKLPARMSVAKFLAWDSPDERQWQLVDGDPQAMAPASRTHGAIQNELRRLIANHLAERASKCSVVAAPGIVPRVRADWNVRIPDLSMTCSEYRTEEAVLSNPVLVIEILSPSSEAETWTNVWACTLRRQADGSWPERSMSVGKGDELSLASIGLSVPSTAAYRTTRLAGA